MKKQNDKAEVILIFVVFAVLGTLGFIALFLAAHLQKRGVSPSVYNPIGFSFFAFELAAIILLCARFKKIALYSIQKELQRIDDHGLSVVESVTKGKLTEGCTRHKFKKRDDIYLYRRKFSLSKDFIHYFVRITDTRDLENDLRRELQCFDERLYKHPNKCLLLFFFSDHIRESDLIAFKAAATSFAVLETAMPGPAYRDNAVIVLVDEKTQKAYTVSNGRRGISVYHNGIKMIQSLLT